MAANASWNDVVTTTLKHRSKEISDNVSDNNAVLKRLKARGKHKIIPGGETLVEELSYAEGRFTWYTGYGTIDVSPKEVFSAAEYDWKQAAAAVSMSGLEELKNDGPERVIGLLDGRIENAKTTMANKMSEAIYGDGTGDGGQQLGGLELLVAGTPTNTVGGISGNTWSFWQNYVYDFSALAITPSKTTIQAAMNQLWMNTRRGMDMIDLIIADNTYFDYYWQSLQAIQRVSTMSGDGAAGAGFTSLKFMNADVVLDGGYGGNAPAGMFGLNTKHLYLCTHTKRNFVPLDRRTTVNQDAFVELIAWAGNMTMSNRFLQGRIQP
ncbi:MAG: phage major capsid protein [Nitratireductor sp.]|nr:phage major capsid protein [Nitratireductor sp.]